MRGKNNQKIILICSTINPSLSLIFLNSLKGTKCNYKVIIINSSNEEFYFKNLDKDIRKNVNVYNLPNVSLSKARNFALKKINNPQILGFPDDDCEYPYGLLDHILENYKNNNEKNSCRMNVVNMFFL